MTATLERGVVASPPPRPAKGAAKVRSRRTWTVLAFMSPAIVEFVIFFAYPLLATLYFSLTRYDLINPPEWIGFDNYVRMFTSEPLVKVAAWNTLWLVVVLTISRVIFALGVASVIARLKSGVGIIRTLCYLPSLAPPVAATLVFSFLLNPEFGPVNAMLDFVGIESPLWFSAPDWAKPALTLLVLWGSGELMIIILASLLDVPQEQYEAASLDGAGPVRRFWHITLPTISPVLMFGIVNSIIFALQFFNQAVASGSVASGSVASGSADVAGSTKVLGFPQNSTLTYPMWLYTQGFRYFNMGYAAAMAVLLFVVSFIFTAILVRQMRKASHVEEGS